MRPLYNFTLIMAFFAGRNGAETTKVAIISSQIETSREERIHNTTTQEYKGKKRKGRQEIQKKGNQIRILQKERKSKEKKKETSSTTTPSAQSHLLQLCSKTKASETGTTRNNSNNDNNNQKQERYNNDNDSAKGRISSQLDKQPTETHTTTTARTHIPLPYGLIIPHTPAALLKFHTHTHISAVGERKGGRVGLRERESMLRRGQRRRQRDHRRRTPSGCRPSSRQRSRTKTGESR